jgi:Tol biopolymer transport system component
MGMRQLGWLIAEFPALLVSLAFVAGGSAHSGVLPVGKIAYAEKGICVVTADGRTQRCHLVRPFVADIYDAPAWSSDGRRIAFQDLVGCSVPGCLDGIFVVNVDGSDLHRVAPASGTSDESPAWSPRGSKIAFSRHFYADQSSGIYVADADRARVRRLYQQAGALGQVDSPTWSPDGRQIAFSDSGAHLYLMNADGSRVRQLRFRGEHPLWSPDGRKMLVQAFLPEGGRAIDVMDAHGTRFRIIARDAWDGAWSPDGRTIAFTCAGPQPGGMGICLVNPDGSGRLRLSFEYVANEVTPAWSPDGEQISYVRYAFAADGSSRTSIMVMNADSSAARLIASPAGVNGTPVWQPRDH